MDPELARLGHLAPERLGVLARNQRRASPLVERQRGSPPAGGLHVTTTVQVRAGSVAMPALYTWHLNATESPAVRLQEARTLTSTPVSNSFAWN
jgi:hypothetical protein